MAPSVYDSEVRLQRACGQGGPDKDALAAAPVTVEACKRVNNTTQVRRSDGMPFAEFD